MITPGFRPIFRPAWAMVGSSMIHRWDAKWCDRSGARFPGVVGIRCSLFQHFQLQVRTPASIRLRPDPVDCGQELNKKSSQEAGVVRWCRDEHPFSSYFGERTRVLIQPKMIEDGTGSSFWLKFLCFVRWRWHCGSEPVRTLRLSRKNQKVRVGSCLKFGPTEGAPLRSGEFWTNSVLLSAFVGCSTICKCFTRSMVSTQVASISMRYPQL